MNITFNFKNFEPSPHLKDYSDSRFGKLAKFFTDSEVSDLQVNLSVEKFRQKAEVVLNADNIHISAYEESEDMYATIDMVLDKLEAQLRKMREKMKAKRKNGRDRSVRMDYLSFSEEADDPIISETDTYVPKPMSVEEAAMQLDSLEYEFLVFRNAESADVNVIYRRKNGDYGLIAPAS